MYTVCDIGLFMLKEICKNADETVQAEWEKTFPGSVTLPKVLFKVDQRLASMFDILVMILNDFCRYESDR